jgi:hypothetical protein
MRCVLVDDDQSFNKEIILDLEGRFPELKDGIEVILTEKAFRDRLTEGSTWDVGFIILDAMIHWADPSEPDLPDPETVRGGYFRAGIRCLTALRSRDDLAQLPVIIHSALDEDRIREKLNAEDVSQSHLEIVTKRSDSTLFFAAIERQIPALAS